MMAAVFPGENYVSPRFFTNFYTYKEQSATFDQYFESFPGPGRPGTLEGVLKGEKEEIKEIIRAKSGSLSSVSMLCRLCKDEEGSY
jgi:D-alanyl-D-alanine carboxypeptidase